MLSMPELIALLLAAVVAAVVARWVRLSYTIALLLLGLVLGVSPLAPVPTLNADVILLLFLPPLIFEAAFVMDLRHLWELRRPVLILAVPGVLVAMGVGGALVHWALDLPWVVALLGYEVYGIGGAAYAAAYAIFGLAVLDLLDRSSR